MKMDKRYYLLICMFFLLSCSNNQIRTKKEHIERVAVLGGERIIELAYIDSLIANQIYDTRLQVLNIESSRYILTYESKRRNISLSELIKVEVNNKSDDVTEFDIKEYMENLPDGQINKDNIKTYLISQKRMDRKQYFVDSLKEALNYEVKLIPPMLSTINTSMLKAFSLNLNKSDKKVFIISDFNCNSCQKAKTKIKELIQKYNNNISFEFIYFSDYIKPTLYQICSIADENNDFKLVHNLFFENMELLSNPFVIDGFPIEFENEFNNMNSNDKQNLLVNAIATKDFLIKNGIYSTPTFIVNNKIIDGEYALDYLDNVIEKEFEINENSQSN